MNNNTWRHVVATVDASYLRVYVNGVEDATPVARTIGDVVSGGTNLIGRYNFGGGDYFLGSIDEFRIYDRALSADEIKQHYQQTRRNLGL